MFTLLIALFYLFIVYRICIRLRRVPSILIPVTYLLVLLGIIPIYIIDEASSIPPLLFQFSLTSTISLSLLIPLLIWVKFKFTRKFSPWMFERKLEEYKKSILGLDKIFYYIKHYESDTIKLLFILYPPMSLFFIDVTYVSYLTVFGGLMGVSFVFLSLIPIVLVIFYVYLSLYYNVRILDTIHKERSTRNSKP